MKYIKAYLTSISKGGRRRFEDLLDAGLVQPVLLEQFDDIEYREIANPDLGEFDIIHANDINSLTMDVYTANRNMWESLSTLEDAVNRLLSFTNSEITSLNQSNSRGAAVIDMLAGFSEDRSIFDSVYVEQFYSTNNTDEASDVDFIDGNIQLKADDREEVKVESIGILYSNKPSRSSTEVMGNRLSISVVTPSILSDAVRGDGLHVDAYYNFGKTKLIDSVRFNSVNSLTVVNIKAVNKEVETDVMTTSTVIKDDTMNLGGKIEADGLIVTYIQPTFTVKTDDPVDSAPIEIYTERTGKVKVSPKKFGQYPTYLIDVTVTPSSNLFREVGSWISNEIVVDGNLKNIQISPVQTQGGETNVTWNLSVNGGLWKPILPYGNSDVLNELVEIDNTGRGYFKFKAEPEIPLTVSGVPEGTTVTEFFSQDGSTVAGILVDGPHSKITVSYAAAVKPGIDMNNFSEINASRIIDSSTDGELGEIIESTSNNTVVLKYEPVGSVEVYAGGVKHTQIGSYESVNDPKYANSPTEYYCKVSGRTIYFSEARERIVVYYKHMRSSVFIKADLTRGNDSTESPLVDLVAVGLSHTE